MNTIDAISGRAQTDRRTVRTSQPTGAAVGVIVTVVRWMGEAAARRRGRLALEAMTEAQLKDIGITRVQADFECAKPFWL